MTQPISEFIRALAEERQKNFEKDRSVLSFQEYLGLVFEAPRTHARTSAQYLLDCFEHFGFEDRVVPTGRYRRNRIFDFVPENSSEFPVEGLNEVQQAIFRAISQFVDQGRVDRLVLLHGPNGSAKSSLISAIMRGLETYSRTDGGPVYRYSWVFPTDRVSRKRVGFADEVPATSALETFAFLPDDETAMVLRGELQETPLNILDATQRGNLLRSALSKAKIDPTSFQLGHAILEGHLCQRSQQIYEALLRSYQGDLKKVLRHVRVERFYLSRMHRNGIATVEPQLHVDAGVRQLTMDQGLAALPKSLQNVALHECFGDLVDANRGIVEYNDLLKRPLEAFKYLLATCEKSTVTVPGQILSLDVVFLGSSNEAHLNEIKQTTDFASFKGRFELIQVPYLRDFRAEAKIYDRQVTPQLKSQHVSPHVTTLAGIWAVLTRLKKPDPKKLPEEIGPLMDRIGPMEKADLFALGQLPNDISAEEATRLLQGINAIYNESRGTVMYEGLFGVSPREMKAILFRAAQSSEHGCVTVNSLTNELDAFIQEKNVYLFLKIEPAGDYHNYGRFTEFLRSRFQSRVTREIRAAMGYVEDSEFYRLLENYLNHAAHQFRKQRLKDPVTGQMVKPDKTLMNEFERLSGAPSEKSDEFRQRMVQRVGAFRVEHPSEDLNLEVLFAKELQTVRDQYHQSHEQQTHDVVRNALDVIDGGGKHLHPSVTDEVHSFIERFQAGTRYCPVCLRESMSMFLQNTCAT
jgi:predicted Ser/Thr protein kinase